MWDGMTAELLLALPESKRSELANAAEKAVMAENDASRAKTATTELRQEFFDSALKEANGAEAAAALNKMIKLYEEFFVFTKDWENKEISLKIIEKLGALMKK